MVYAIHPTEDGTMHVALYASTWKSVIYAFAPAACGKSTKAVACKDSTYEETKFALKVTKDKYYSIVVDGRDDSSGPFSLSVELLDPTCGDGVVDSGEDCDFGVKGSLADGCDLNCHFIQDPGYPTSDSCPTITWPVTTAKPLTVPGPSTIPGPMYTSGYKDDIQACGAEVGGPDRVFGFSLMSAGTLTVGVTADFDVVLAAYTTCGATWDGLLACSDAPTPVSTEQLVLTGPKGATFFIVIDGYDAKSFGSFTLTAALK